MQLEMADTELKTKHRVMWGKGDYPLMVDTFLLPVGQRLADAAGISSGVHVLDVAAGTGNASIPAAQRGARVTASDLTPDLLAAGSRRPEAEGLDIDWVEADAENLPFEDGSFDVVMSASWTPEGMLGDLFRTMKPFAPPPPPGAQPPPLWGSEQHLAGLFGDRVEFHRLERDNLEITAFAQPRDYGEHFKAYYGPTIAVRANAAKDGREGEFDEALDRFCDTWNLGTSDQGRFEKEYLLAVGTRA